MTKKLGRLTLLLTSFSLLFAVFFGFCFGKNKTNTKAFANEQLINLNDSTVLTDKFNVIGANFNTISGAAYNASSNPYAIENANDLIRLAYYVNIDKNATYAGATYKLTNHINLSGYNWCPIGSLETGAISFSGVLNGDGYSIYGLTINLFFDSVGGVLTTSTEPNSAEPIDNTVVGLFGSVKNEGSNTVIKLLGLSNTSIKTNAFYTGALVGMIAGDSSDTNINLPNLTVADATASAVVQECYNTGTVYGGIYVGGIAGFVKDGAVVFNCLNAEPETTKLNEVTYGEENTTGNIAIYSPFANANVAGIVGGVEEISNKAVVISTINTASVAKFGNGENVGGIVGYYPSSSKTRYGPNVFFEEEVKTSNLSACVGNHSNVNALRDYRIYQNRFSMTGMQQNEYIPYSRGETPDAIWHRGDAVNNGLPYLTRVNILARVELRVAQTDGITPATVNFNGYNTDGQKVSVMDWYRPVVLSGSVFFIEQGKSVPLDKQIKSEYASTFEFLRWNVNAVPSNITNHEKESGLMNSDILFVSSDGVYTVVYDYIYYEVNLASNNNLFGTLTYQNPVSSNSLSVNWDDVEQQTGSVVRARINDVVRVTACANAGYELNDVTPQTAQTITPINSNTVEFVVLDNNSLTFNFAVRQYSVETNIPLDASNQPLCDLDFSVNGGAFATSVNNALFNDYISIRIANISQNYFIKNFIVSADGMDDLVLAEGVSSFLVPNYNNIVISPVFTKQTYSVTIQHNSNNYDVVFVLPLTQNIQCDIAFDEEFSVEIINISEGYNFVEWQVNYDGDSAEIWNTTSQILSKTGLSGNVVLTPIISINSYVVTLGVIGNGSFSGDATQNIDYGRTLSSTATPDAGNKFVAWVDENGELITKKPQLVCTITEDFEAYAKFSVVNYTLTFSVVADDGAVFDTNTITQTNVSGEYSYNDDVEFSIIIPAGYDFAGWELKTDLPQNTYQLNEDGTGSISSIAQNVFMVAHLATKQFDVKFGINDVRFGGYKFNYSGWTSFSDQIMSQVFNYGYKSELQAYILNQNQAQYPSEARNYAFSYWMVNGVPYETNSILTISVNENLNVVACFRPLNYKLVVTKTINDAATITGCSSDYFEYGTTVKLGVNVNTGYQFNGWYQYVPKNGQNVLELISSETTLDIAINSSKNILCSLSKLGGIVASVNDVNSGEVSGTGEFKIGTRVTLVAHPKDGFVFSAWKQNGKIISQETSLTLDVNEGIKDIEAVFTPKFNVDVAANNSKLGSVNIVESQTSEGEIQLVALASNNCSFVGWSYNDEIINTNSVYNLKLNGDIKLKAIFERDFNWNILIIVAGCVIFAIALIIIAIQYAKSKEAEPVNSRFIMTTNDDKKILPRKKKNAKKDIEAIPVRKVNPGDIEPVPVRKTYTQTNGYVPKKPSKPSEKPKK